MSFQNFNFNNHISSGLKNHGYVTPTPIQTKAIMPILDGRDLLGLAQTGTGKTAAFVLPILQRLSNSPGKKIKALIVSPTRELAEQTHNYIGKFSTPLNLHSNVIYGGVSKGPQIQKLRKGVDIIVACPGRLLDLANDKLIDLSAVTTLVLDEADQMFDKGFLPDIKRIIKLLPATRQNLIFSATMPKEVQSLVDGLLTNPVEVKIDHTKAVENISHKFYRVEASKKSSLLKSVLQDKTVETAIVFTRTKYKAKKLAIQLEKCGHKATSLQGNLSQQQRQKALEGFKNGTYNILVATDIAARGIDVEKISHVINYDMPETIETYTHRTGRTGRASQTGVACTFATADNLKMVKALERKLGKNITSPLPSEPEEPAHAPAGETKKKKIVSARAKTNNRTKGKRSSQRNRAIAFDFGI